VESLVTRSIYLPESGRALVIRRTQLRQAAHRPKSGRDRAFPRRRSTIRRRRVSGRALVIRRTQLRLEGRPQASGPRQVTLAIR